MSKLIIIRGNSGSGKTTLAKALQAELGSNTLIISQDVVRREMLRTKDGANNKAIPLLMNLIEYGNQHCDFVIIEGILNASWYESVFDFALELFGENIYAYRYKLEFLETLRRHRTKPNRDDFVEIEMNRWWIENDVLPSIPETILNELNEVNDVVVKIKRRVDL